MEYRPQVRTSSDAGDSGRAACSDEGDTYLPRGGGVGAFFFVFLSNGAVSGGFARRHRPMPRPRPVPSSRKWPDVAERPRRIPWGGDDARAWRYNFGQRGGRAVCATLPREGQTAPRHMRCIHIGHVVCRSSTPTCSPYARAPSGNTSEGTSAKLLDGGGLWRITTFLLHRASRPRTIGGL